MKLDSSHQLPPIAVVGVSALFPGSVSTGGFWRDILAGTDLITDVPATHWLAEDYYDPDPSAPDKTYARRGAFLPEIDFDAMGFGVPPSIVPATDTSQLMALIVAQRVLDDACGGDLGRVDRERTSVILGATSAQELYGHMVSRLQRPVWVKALRESGLPESQVQAACNRIADHYVPWQESTFPGLLGNVIAGRIANRLDLGGTNCVTDAACASSFSAVSMAVNELVLGQSRLVIVGGVDTMNDPLMFMCFAKTPALSPSGDCRPFSAAADGTMLGEGIGMVALKRLADAERDGDRVYAVLRGVGTSSDGRSKSVYAPLAAGQARALRRAYGAAGYGPGTVELVEAHGTGTTAGDAAELEGLRTVFDESGREQRQYCALGTVKSQIGHTKAASGAAGLFKVIMALHHRVLPPTIKVDLPNPELALESSAFYLNTETRPWIRGSDHPRRASVSSFGFGGSNFHLTLEEYNGPAPSPQRLRGADHELVILCADSAAELTALAHEHADHATEPGVLQHLAYTSQEGYRHDAEYRLAVVAGGEKKLRSRLEKAARLIEGCPDQHFSMAAGVHYGVGARKGDVAFLFPGQGSQYVGMGSALAVHFAAARAAWDGAADLGLEPGLHEIVFPRPAFNDEEREAQAGRLTATEWAQPAIGCVSLSMLSLLAEMGVEPACVGGHSFGDVTALHAAGVLSAEDLLRVARLRGEVMAAAATNPGSMTAVAITVEELSPLLTRYDTDVVIANHNSPSQVVLSGATEAIAEVERLLERDGITATRLPVATAFHSKIVSASCEPFAERLAEIPFDTPRIAAFANATAAPYPADPEAARRCLAEQIASPVRFVEQVEAMYARGVSCFIEVGPSSVLTGLTAQILDGRPHLAVNLDRRGQGGLRAFMNGIGSLAAGGLSMVLGALWRDYQRPEDPRTRQRPRAAIPLVGANYGRPYPPREGAAGLPEPNPEPTTELQEESMSDKRAADAAAETTVPRRAVSPPRAPADPWLAAFEEAQRRTAEAHTTFQRTMADAHEAFLKTAEAGFASLGQLAGSGHGADLGQTLEVTAPQAGPDAIRERKSVAAVAKAPPTIAPEQVAIDAPELPSDAPLSPAPPASQPTNDIEALLLTVVADKTGYPAEMLSLEMDLEADLGIDSIKRVEILSAMVERAPHLPEVDAAEMVNLKTLAQIVGYLQEGSGDGEIVATKAASPAVEADGDGTCMDEVGRYVLEIVDAPALGMAQPGLLRGGTIAVTDDGGGVAVALAGMLSARGVTAEVVTAAPDDASGLIFLGGLRSLYSVDDAVAVNREAFAVARSFAGRGRLFVTVQDTGGRFGVDGVDPVQAPLGGLAGLAKTATLEWPGLSVKAIDLERAGRGADELARVLAKELFSGGPEVEVGLSADGRRTTLRSMRAEVDGAQPVIEEGDVIVVSGGGRGITALTLRALAAERGRRFLLLGRTPLEEEPDLLCGVEGDGELKRVLLAAAVAAGEQLTPPELGRRVARVQAVREICATLEALRAEGCEARYAAVDVTDSEAVAVEIERIRSDWGAVHGVIHGAGVLADRLIVDKTDADFDRVFDTKVEGLRALLDATSGDELKLLVCFSSVAARSGNVGQCDYAMANEVLNKVAVAEQRRRGSGCVVKSLGWGPWDGGMVSAELKSRFESAGVPLISPEAGTRLMLNELGAAHPRQVEVVLGGRPAPSALLSGGAIRDFTMNLVVDRRSHPYLEAHAIEGLPVVPVVLAVEWFARVARALRPDLELECLHELKVLRGVRLLGFNDGGDRLVLEGHHAASNGRVTLEMRVVGTDGTPFYTATARLVSRRGLPSGGLPRLELDEWNGRQVYGGVLFHGPQFQVIREVDGISDQGVAATIAGIREHRWSAETWRTDAASLDGGLQLALLWSERVLGGASLPTAIEEVRTWTDELPSGPISCVLEGREAANGRTLSDVHFASPSGELLAELLGVETHKLPRRDGS